METPAEIALVNEALRVVCTPANGFSLSALVDRASGADALWRRPGFAPAPGSRALGVAGVPSEETFFDLFAGGWFEMFPEVGYPQEDDVASFVHGEVVRLPWELVDQGAAHAEARVLTVRRPLTLTRRIELDGGTVRVTQRAENVGAAPVPYSWGHHPCFSRETFAGGRLEIPVAESTIPEAADPDNSILAPGRFDWPHAAARDAANGETVDLGEVPPTADRRHDHACLVVGGGEFRLTAPSAGRALRVTFDPVQFPFVLLWECFGAGDGAPFWGGWDTFGVEFSTIPGRGTPDAVAAGAIRTLAPGESVATEWSVGWEAL